MEIVSKSIVSQDFVTGRMSDGSDRKVVTTIDAIVTVKEGFRTFIMKFDHDPTDEEIAQKFKDKNYTETTSQQDLARSLDALQEQIDALILSTLEVV